MPGSREMAQLQLAERIIAEKDHELHEVGAKADQFMIEKEILEEELATVRTSIGGVATSQEGSVTMATNSTSPPQTRVSMYMYSLSLSMCVYRIAGNFRGRKLSQISRFYSHP